VAPIRFFQKPGIFPRFHELNRPRMSIRPVIALLVSAFFPFYLAAQQPVPAGRQAAPVLILGATAHLGNGQVLTNSAIAFENGKLTIVADASNQRFDRTKFGRIYDAAGKHVYPGFIATNSLLGLVEIDAVRATQDFDDVGELLPNQRALIAYNTDSEIIPTVRSNGVLLAQVVPTGATIAGQSSVVQLDAWSWEDAALRADDGIHLYWPNRSGVAVAGDENAQKRAEQYEKELQALSRFFNEARAYQQAATPVERNLKFESLRALFDGRQKLYIHTAGAKSMQEAVLFAEQHKVQPVLVGAEDAFMVADFLKTHNVPVILSKTQRLPQREDEAVDQPYRTPAVLHEKGVLFALSEQGTWRQRNLGFEAGQAVGYGLPYEAAVASITLHAARILGIEATTGSLEVGKDATLFISEGDALDMRTSRVVAAFIQGREINLDDKHKALYRRFEEKYKN
jgi:imidazolonepropionase-like amidohydrolase